MSVKIEDANDEDTVNVPPATGQVWDQLQQNAFRPQLGAQMGTDYTLGDGSMMGMQGTDLMHHQPQLHRDSTSSQLSSGSMGASSTVKEPVPLPQLSRASGPMSSTVTIPPRPRPGRKPIAQENAADRRRLQNRIAQRNFRDKRQQKLVETQCELEVKKQDYQESINELERKLQEVRESNRVFEEENARLKKRATEAEQRAKQAETKLNLLLNSAPQTLSQMYARPKGLQNAFTTADLLSLDTHVAPTGGYRDPTLITPPLDSANEIDYTNWGRNGSSQRKRNHNRTTSSSDSMGSQMDYPMNGLQAQDERCGFCTDDQNCSCRAEKRIPAVETLPGSCDACQQNPARAQACRDLAALTQIAPRAPTSNNTYPNNGTAAMPPPSTTCLDIVDEFKSCGQRTSSIPSLTPNLGVLHAWPSRDGGYEIAEQEAAQVLSGLSRRNPSTSGMSPRGTIEGGASF